MDTRMEDINETAIAIIGMSGRFPGAENIDQFWCNLKNGIESIRQISDEELLRRGIKEDELNHPDYVKVLAAPTNITGFDAGFFGFTPREAQVLDPQQRLFFECAWEALESAAIVPDTTNQSIGVFGGVGMNNYILLNLASNPEIAHAVGPMSIRLLNDKDFLTTQISYRLNLHGPSVLIGTACSTSLVAVHTACQSLLSYECDVALAGGVTINLPHGIGYYYREGGILSPDGHCRPFDIQAKGTVGGSGAGIVVLKRLRDAILDQDPIRAVILGSAINNDGSRKVGYTSPSVSGQAEVIAMAQEIANVEPDTITYVEAHGTATPMGDPIEVAALTQAFRERTEQVGYCTLGSVKGNIGHLDAAAGVVGLIKTVLALEHKQLPPTLHFKRPNPELHLETSPFRVNNKLEPWKTNGDVYRAGVSSFGIGGTNAHVIVEEAPSTNRKRNINPSPSQLLLLSGRSASVVHRQIERLVDYLEKNPQVHLADVAHTLQIGRKAFEYRTFVTANSVDEAIHCLREKQGDSLDKSWSSPQVYFLFPGQGAQYETMGKNLYQSVPTFRKAVDECAHYLLSLIDADIREVLFQKEAFAKLNDTRWTQIGLFVVEYSLAQVFLELGIQPTGLLGHSLGEWVAACLAGVVDLKTALQVIVARAEAMATQPKGAMLALNLSSHDVQEWLSEEISLTGILGSNQVVVGGPIPAIEQLEQKLVIRKVRFRRLNTSHAFHSMMMEPAADQFKEAIQHIRFHSPKIPFISNVTGDWITSDQATDPEYWAKQVRSPVRLGLDKLMNKQAILLEIGPGDTLGRLAFRQKAVHRVEMNIVTTMGWSNQEVSEIEGLLSSIGKLWERGEVIRFQKLFTYEDGVRISLPTYAFERQHYWIDSKLSPSPYPTRTHIEGKDQPHLVTTNEKKSLEEEDEYEKLVAQQIAHVLGIEDVKATDDFFELGGTSLLVPEVLIGLEQRLGKQIPLRMFFENTKVRKLAAVLRKMNEKQQPDTKTVDFVQDSLLPADIIPVQGEGQVPFQEVLLTGATGFVGSFVLKEIMEQTNAQVTCIIRAATTKEAMQKIYQSKAGSMLHPYIEKGRIRCVLGDLTQPNLGLLDSVYNELLTRIDTVFHIAAKVSYTLPYQWMREVTVKGTEQMIRFASTKRLKPLHLMSTLAVFSNEAYKATENGLEVFSVPHPEGLQLGYGQSKWVSEQLVVTASERGLPVTIHRPGMIGGDSQTGILNQQDFMWNLIVGCIQLGCAPESDQMLDLAPIDYVAGGMVHLAQCPEHFNQAFHYVNRTRITWKQLFSWIQEIGYPIKMMPLEEWAQKIISEPSKVLQTSLGAFIPMFRSLDSVSPINHFSDQKAYDSMNGHVRCEPMSKKLIMNYIDYLKLLNYLPSQIEE
ncbi:type I polyketide synthase [Thermoflavimicrobium daqui]|uniref:Polyketide synthase n=1 Tax=Thermoflavimicrobium daqui TaxID=2137476 RepID=A0A364K5G2_9BACL|nr:type I polyketide synthase [Thermoflavimicrobium daqui]RAL24605.1 polyketide synthase [Thermoflavimicrobium daqui]